MKALKNGVIMMLFLGLGILFFSSCNPQKKTQEAATESQMNQEKAGENQSHALSYTCSMHPEVKSDKPGKCPKCGMELAQATTDQLPASDSSSHNR
jgi:uncharacterized paraquat-inducible protein A